MPRSAATLTHVDLNVDNPDDSHKTLQLGMDESYTLDVPTTGTAAIRAPAVWGALRALETLAQMIEYLLRGMLMSTWGFWPAVFRPLRTVFPGLGAGFLNLAGKTERTAKKRGKNEQKWARNGLKRVGVS